MPKSKLLHFLLITFFSIFFSQMTQASCEHGQCHEPTQIVLTSDGLEEKPDKR